MKLRQLPKLNSINGNKTESNKRLKDVDIPRENKDAVNKKWVEDNFTPI